VLSGAGLIVAGAAGAALLGVGVATGAATTSSSEYFVKFTKPIGHCAAVVEIGKAGGTGDSTPASPIVVPGGKQSFDITFELPQSRRRHRAHA
jgi:hypothetical protein